MRRALIVLVLALASHPVRAQMPPTFDMIGWCRDDVAAGAFPEDGVLGCVAAEQRKARELRSTYRSVPPTVRSYCETFARQSTNDRGSYAVLDFCIGMQKSH